MTLMGRLIFNATGIMCNRGVVKNSEIIGKRIVDTMKNNADNISTSEIEQIIADTVGKKAAKKIHIINTKDEARECMLDNNICSEQGFETTWKECLGLTIPHKYRRHSTLLAKDKNSSEILGSMPQEIQSSMYANIMAHEVQHALGNSSGQTGLRTLIGKFSWGRKYLDKLHKRMNEINGQKKYIQLQNLGLEQVLKGEENFATVIKELMYKKGILKVGDNKNNAFLLRELRKVYQDEQRSYTVGGKTGCYYTGNNNNEDDIVMLFKKLEQAIKQEERHILSNRVKSFFGFKPNYEREEKMIENVRHRELTSSEA